MIHFKNSTKMTKFEGILAPLVILLIVIIFSSGYLFKGLVPFPSRYLVNHFSPWNTESKYGIPVKNNAMPDVIGQIYPWKKFTIDTWKSGEIPLWNPYSFSGTPHLANYQSQVFSPTNILYFFLPFLEAWSIQILLQPLLAGLFMYLFMRSIKTSLVSSLLSAISFMFCGFITTWMAYGTLGYAILFTPLALYAIERYHTRKDFWTLILLAISISFSFFSGHFQTSLYMFLVVVGYIVWESFFKKNIKETVILLITSFSGLLISFPQILPSIEFYQNSVREQIIQKMEVIPWRYLQTRIAPDFYGNPVTRNDWFGHYAEWNSYAGIVPFLLSFFVFLRKIDRKISFFILLFIVSLALSFDTFFADLMVALKIPLFSTSAASRIVVLSSISVAVLGGLGLDRLMNTKKIRKVFTITGVWTILMILLWISVFFGNPEQENLMIARNNSILPTLLFGGLVGCVGLFIAVKNKKLKNFAVFGVLFLTAFEMLRFSLKWMPFEEREYIYPSTTTTVEFKKLSSPQNRWYLDTHAENALIYNLPISDGYDPLYYKRYGEFIKYIVEGKISEGERSLVTFPKNGIYTDKALNLLGIRYIAYRVSDARAPWAFPYWKYPEGRLKEIFHDGKYTIFKNSQSLPKAHAVTNILVKDSDEKVLEALFDKNFDATRSAIVEEELVLSTDKTGNVGDVTIESYKNNTVVLSSDSSSDAIIVLNDVLYPGWNVYVDGIEKKMIRVNYIFRGVLAESGKHTIVYQYKPMSFKIGIVSAGFGIMVLILLSIINNKYAKEK